ncbi:hypothetical protein [Variovorax sp. PAMC26660]|uniref:hypothetical protein n=1 Tax=Variovorax sp. PAMC26660 TaxID=2762322 RepID=UPI00164E6131|nr:hypothetical protein [Variovorax sp. PAMC26660]QNK65882.1 hypothetical protein H7F35_22050 [Variovorax sp. PAMC26660]
MDFQEFTSAVEAAKSDIKRGDTASRNLASLLCGRLRVAGVAGYVLAELKRELQDFNRQTGTWKERE